MDRKDLKEWEVDTTNYDEDVGWSVTKSSVKVYTAYEANKVMDSMEERIHELKTECNVWKKSYEKDCNQDNWLKVSEHPILHNVEIWIYNESLGQVFNVIYNSNEEPSECVKYWMPIRIPKAPVI